MVDYNKIFKTVSSKFTFDEAGELSETAREYWNVAVAAAIEVLKEYNRLSEAAQE